MPAVIAFVLLLVTACSKDAAEITKEYRPKAEPRMNKLVAALKEYPSVEKAPVDKLRFSGSTPNALLGQAGWFDSRTDTHVVVSTGALKNVRDALRGAEPIPSSYNYEPDYKAFLGAKYVVLVDVTITPVLTEGESFVGGGGTFSMSIFEIDSGKKVDTLEVASGAADKVLVAQGKESEGIAAETMRGLRQQANNAIAPYLATGEKPPF